MFLLVEWELMFIRSLCSMNVNSGRAVNLLFMFLFCCFQSITLLLQHGQVSTRCKGFLLDGYNMNLNDGHCCADTHTLFSDSVRGENDKVRCIPGPLRARALFSTSESVWYPEFETLRGENDNVRGTLRPLPFAPVPLLSISESVWCSDVETLRGLNDIIDMPCRLLLVEQNCTNEVDARI